MAVYFYVPETFDPARFPALKGLHDEANWFLNKIICTAHAYRHQPCGESDFGVPLLRQTMRQFMDAGKVSDVRSALIDGGVVECNGKYKIALQNNGDGRLMEYRIAPPYVGDLKRVECRKRSLARRVQLHRIRIGDRCMREWEPDDLDQYLYGWLRKLKIDLDKANKIIGDVEPKALKKARKKVVVGSDEYYQRLLHDTARRTG